MLEIAVGVVLSALDRPWKWADERHNEVNQRPSNDDVVVSHDTEGREDGRKADSSESRMDSTEHSNITSLELLTKGKLHESHGDTNGEQADPVRDEEESTTPLITQIGEAPEVSETDTVADHSKNESGAGEPSSSLGTLVFVSKDVEAFCNARVVFDCH